MNLLSHRRIAVVAVIVAAALLVTAGAAVATTWIVKGRTVKAVAVASADNLVSTYSGTWSDVPNMSIGVSVASSTHALFLITFAAENKCGACTGYVRVLLNEAVVVPVENPTNGVIFATASELQSNSMQWVASPIPAGQYTIKVQYRQSSGGIGTSFNLGPRTLSVVKSVI